MNLARIVAVKATSDADAADGETIPRFSARIMIFHAEHAAAPTESTLDPITDQDEIDVFNLGGIVKSGDNLVAAQTVDRRWVRIAERGRCKAKWIKFQYTSGAGYTGLLDHWSGTDPTEGGETPTIEYPLGEPCDDAEVMAFCDENTGNYQAISTEAAMLGPATTMNVMQALAFDGCGINYTYQSAKVFPCQSEPAMISTSPSLTSQSVLTGMQFLDAIEACEGTCEYTWSESLEAWSLTGGSDSACGEGCVCGPAPTDPPGAGDPTVVEVSCVRSDGLTPRDASFCFGTATVLVCSAAAGSPSCVPLAECPDPEY